MAMHLSKPIADVDGLFTSSNLVSVLDERTSFAT